MTKPKRVYVIEHTMMTVNGTTMEPVTLYYDYTQRQEFIDSYLRRKDEWYTVDIKTYYAELQEIDVGSMMNAI